MSSVLHQCSSSSLVHCSIQVFLILVSCPALHTTAGWSLGVVQACCTFLMAANTAGWAPMAGPPSPASFTIAANATIHFFSFWQKHQVMLWCSLAWYFISGTAQRFHNRYQEIVSAELPTICVLQVDLIPIQESNVDEMPKDLHPVAMSCSLRCHMTNFFVAYVHSTHIFVVVGDHNRLCHLLSPLLLGHIFCWKPSAQEDDWLLLGLFFAEGHSENVSLATICCLTNFEFCLGDFSWHAP